MNGYERMIPGFLPKEEATATQVSDQQSDSSTPRCEGRVELTKNARISQEEAQRNYDAMLKRATDLRDLPLDVWGAMFFVIIKDFPDVLTGDIRHENALRTIFVMICYGLNIFLQVMLLWWICTMVTLPAVRQAQTIYRDFHQDAFRSDGSYDLNLFQALPFATKEEVCEIVLSRGAFLCAILFLWVAQCFDELRQVTRRVRLLSNLPPLPEELLAKEMVAEAKYGSGIFEERKLLLICLNRITKVFLAAFIFIPKSFIATLLCVAGCVWLTASLSFGDLILNSLALAFVVKVDELIFGVFLPARLATNLSDTNIALPVDESKSEEERDRADMQGAYRRSVIFLILVTGSVAVFMVFQPVLPGYQWDVGAACAAFNSVDLVPWCLPWNSTCFPKGGGAESDTASSMSRHGVSR